MSNTSTSATKLKSDDYLQKCVKYLNGTAYDVINGHTKLLGFAASNTILIPPIPHYSKIMRKKQRPCLGPAGSETLEIDENKKGYTRGFETDVFVSKYFARFGPGGIYLSNLKIHELISVERKKTSLKHFLPDAKDIYDYLESKADIEIDGILIHPRIGLAVIENKSVNYTKQEPKKDQNRLPKELFGKDGAMAQVKRNETFLLELFSNIFGKVIPFPVYTIVCAPNADIGQSTISESTYLLDTNVFNENGENFQLIWNQIMTLETEISKKEFIQFAAVLITLKTAFGFVSTFNSNIISAANDFLAEHRSLLDDTARKQQTQLKQQNKLVHFWLNGEQLNVYEYNPGKHFVIGPPGSGKTLLLKARILKFRERAVRIFCPYSLTFQYQQFIRDNDLQDKVEVLTFSELINIAKLLKNCKTEGVDFLKRRYGYIFSPDVNIYCDEMDDKTFTTEKVHQIFQLRPGDAETFVIGESPDALINPIFKLLEAYQKIGYLTTSLKTMMRSSIEIIEYFLSLNQIAPHHNIRAGHSLKFKDIQKISYKNENDAIKKLIKCINIKKDDYCCNDMAVITLKYHADDVISALIKSNIATKQIDDDADTSAITILTPFQSKSYEWKVVIVWIDMEHEQATSLAITRASIELIILQQEILDEGKKKQIKEIYLSTCGTAERGQECKSIVHKEKIQIHSYQQTNKCKEEYQKVNLTLKDQRLNQNRIKHDSKSNNPCKENFCDTISKTSRNQQSLITVTKQDHQKEYKAQYVSDAMCVNNESHSKVNKQKVKSRKREDMKHNDTQIQYNQGALHAQGEDIQNFDTKADKWSAKVPEQSYAEAPFDIEASYAEMQDVPQSDGEAIKWYKKAAEQYHAYAQYNLAVSNRNRQGIPQSFEETVKGYRKAADKDDADAQYDIGGSYAKGQGLPQSYEEAVKWYRKAAEQGHAQAQFKLGLCYDKSHGVPQSSNEAVKWFMRAAEQGIAEAQFFVKNMIANDQYTHQPEETFLIYCRQVSETINIKAEYDLGLIYATGQGVPQSAAEAVKWFRKSAEQGYAQAQCDLGVSYGEGQGVPQSYEEAVKWLRKAAEQGHAQAQYNIAVIYDNGQGVLQSDQEAIKWYRRAADQGHVDSQYNLGVHYVNGHGVLQSYKEALNWYRKAAEQGHAEAQYNLGVHYARGQGVPQSNKEAVKWYRKAAERGYIDV